jgi:hypothetical protein
LLADNATLRARVGEAEEKLHYANGVADLAMKHRDEAEATVADLEGRLERAHVALQEIARWSEAYPLDIFPEPDFAKAHQVLKANGMTIDAISASAVRHAIEGVGKIARNALAASDRRVATVLA